MSAFNSKIKKGRVSKAPLIILLAICLVIIIIANFAVNSNTTTNTPNKRNNFDTKSSRPFAAMRIDKLQKESQIHDENQVLPENNETTDIQELPIEKEEDNDFDASYDAYLRLEAREKEQNYEKPNPVREKRRNDFDKALKAQTKVELNFNNRNEKRQHLTEDMQYLSPSQQQELNKSRLQLKNLQQNSSNNIHLKNLSSYNSLENNDYKLGFEVESITTPYVINQGNIIPAVLLSGINSDLPGQITAQVTSDVLDSPLGNYILIPKGSKLIGQYAAAPDFGQTRIMLGFNRLIFPDGKSLNLGSMPGTGADGYSGFNADVNNHLLKLMSYSVLLGGITTLVTLSTDSTYDDNGKITPQSALSQSMGEILGRTMSQVIERNLNISPTLTVKPGFRFNVAVTKDIEFTKEYEGYDYAK